MSLFWCRTCAISAICSDNCNDYKKWHPERMSSYRLQLKSRQKGLKHLNCAVHHSRHAMHWIKTAKAKPSRTYSHHRLLKTIIVEEVVNQTEMLTGTGAGGLDITTVSQIGTGISFSPLIISSNSTLCNMILAFINFFVLELDWGYYLNSQVRKYFWLLSKTNKHVPEQRS